MRIIISPEAYEKIKNESMFAVKELGTLIEFVGIIRGRISEDLIEILDFERLPKDLVFEGRTTKQKLLGIPVGGKIATQKIEDYVSQIPDVIGFYHTHPNFSTSLTSGDLEEFQTMNYFSTLSNLNKLHVISAVKGAGFLAKPKDPVFYVLQNGQYFPVEVDIEKTSNQREIDIIPDIHLTNSTNMVLNRAFNLEDINVDVEKGLARLDRASKLLNISTRSLVDIVEWYRRAKPIHYDIIFLEVCNQTELDKINSGERNVHDYIDNEILEKRWVTENLRSRKLNSELNDFQIGREALHYMYSMGKKFYAFDLPGRESRMNEIMKERNRLYEEAEHGNINFERAKSWYDLELSKLDKLREKYMIKNILEKASNKNLLIIGTNHIQQVAPALEKAGLKVNIRFDINEARKEIDAIFEEKKPESVSEPIPEKKKITIRPKQEQLPSPKGYFFKALKQQFETNQVNVKQLQELLYQELLNIGPDNPYKEGVAKVAAERMDSRGRGDKHNFQNLELQRKIIEEGTSVQSSGHVIASSKGKPFTSQELIDWLVNHRMIPERAKKYFEE